MLCCCHVYSILKENSKTPTTSLQDTKGTAPATAAHGNAGATDVPGDSHSTQGGVFSVDRVRFGSLHRRFSAVQPAQEAAALDEELNQYFAKA